MSKKSGLTMVLLVQGLVILLLVSCSEETSTSKPPTEITTSTSPIAAASMTPPEPVVEPGDPSPIETPIVASGDATDISSELLPEQEASSPTETPTPAPSPMTVPFFETTSCSFLQMSPGGPTVHCGYLSVLENRDNPSSRVIKLPVAILKAQTPNPEADPLIYVAPGGGLDAMPFVQYYAQTFADVFTAERDFIFYNQRGAPRAIPELQCPGYERLLYDQAKKVTLTDDERIGEKVEFLRLCADQLRAEGAELEMYSSTANAADLADLIQALGLEQVNILGVSYGTNVGLALLRDRPMAVRSIILDSVYPPQIAMNSSRAPNAYDAAERLFSTCLEEEACNQAYPDLKAIFYGLIEKLNLEPVTTNVTGWETHINGGIFSEAIYSMLIEGKVEVAPKAIYEAESGDFSRIERYVPDILNAYPPGDQDYLSEGVFYSLTCREEVPFDSYDLAFARAADIPESLAGHFLTLFARWQFSLCEAWDIEPADPIVDQPVSSDIPTLILAGQFDPITPPEWATMAAETLDHSYIFKFPGLGHGIIDGSACAQKLAVRFLEDPHTEPDDPCFEDLLAPDFK